MASFYLSITHLTYQGDCGRLLDSLELWTMADIKVGAATGG
jgi:hypothetical protein